MAPSSSSDLLRRIDSVLVAINKFIIGSMLAIMVTLVFVNVISRYVFDASLDWIEEVTRYMMIWLVYLAAGLALRNGNHVAVTMVMDMMPTPIRKLARIVVLALIIGFMAAIAWLGTRYALFAWNRTTPILDLSYGLLYLALPIGAALIVLHALIDWRSQTSLDPSSGSMEGGDPDDGRARDAA